jgi:hypothetical protein
METIEGYSFSSTIIALDSQGAPAASARTATSLYLTWFFHNASAHAVQLIFPRGQLFTLNLLDDSGESLWESPAPTPGNDYVVAVPAGGSFSVPDGADPAAVPRQVPVIPLAQVIAAKEIPASAELHASIIVPLFGGHQRIITKLWLPEGIHV